MEENEQKSADDLIGTLAILLPKDKEILRKGYSIKPLIKNFSGNNEKENRYYDEYSKVIGKVSILANTIDLFFDKMNNCGVLSSTAILAFSGTLSSIHSFAIVLVSFRVKRTPSWISWTIAGNEEPIMTIVHNKTMVFLWGFKKLKFIRYLYKVYKPTPNNIASKGNMGISHL